MKKLQKLALENAKIMTPQQMKSITGGYNGKGCLWSQCSSDNYGCVAACPPDCYCVWLNDVR